MPQNARRHEQEELMMDYEYIKKLHEFVSKVLIREAPDKASSVKARLYLESGCGWSATCRVAAALSPNVFYRGGLGLVEKYLLMDCEKWFSELAVGFGEKEETDLTPYQTNV